MSAVPLAFYAPLKPPDHPVPSGDRTMARLLLEALTRAGFSPEIASRLRTHDPDGSAAHQASLAAAGQREAERILRALEARAAADRPRLWFTYHCYYKAPDHLGPLVSRRLGIPYAVAEASRSPKRAQGPWALGHAASEQALNAADIVFALTGRDRPALERARPPGQRIVDLPPFVDGLAVDRIAEPADRPRIPGRLLTVAMMRPGDKLLSYRLLADALDRVGEAWSLDIVGDGPERPAVEQLFARCAERVVLHGRLEGDALAARYREAELLVWPAVNEAYGMVLLEAQAAGCPVVAGAFGGVPDAMRPGETGLMPPAGDVGAFAAAVSALLADGSRRRGMGAAARRFVGSDRTLDGAARVLRDTLLGGLGTGSS